MIQKSAQNDTVRAFILKSETNTLPTILNAIDDNSQSLQGNSSIGHDFILDPVKNPIEMLDLIHKSGILKQCIDTLVLNIYGVGFKLDNRYPDLEKDDQYKDEIKKEYNLIKEFLESVDVNGTGSLSGLLKRLGYNIESTGFGAIEILYKSNKPYAFNLLESVNLKMTDYDPEIVFYDRSYYDYDSMSWKKEKVPARFRRYVQIQNGEYRYFKSLDDPRIVDHITGEYWTQKQFNKLPKNQKNKIVEANSIWFFNLYSPLTPFGCPRWIGAINSVIGSIKKEINDINYFTNHMKSDIIITSNVPLEDQTLAEIKSHFKVQAKLENSHKALFISPDPKFDLSELGDKPILDVKQLETKRDAHFIDYDQKNMERVISACGLSKISVGMSSSYNKATALASMEQVENNTFLPSRQMIDDFINNKIFPLLGIKYHVYKSQSSTKQSLKDKAEIIKMLKDSGLTLRELRTVISPLLNVNLTDVSAEWLDYPLGVAVSLIQNQNNEKSITKSITKSQDNIEYLPIDY